MFYRSIVSKRKEYFFVISYHSQVRILYISFAKLNQLKFYFLLSTYPSIKLFVWRLVDVFIHRVASTRASYKTRSFINEIINFIVSHLFAWFNSYKYTVSLSSSSMRNLYSSIALFWHIFLIYNQLLDFTCLEYTYTRNVSRESNFPQKSVWFDEIWRKTDKGSTETRSEVYSESHSICYKTSGK